MEPRDLAIVLVFLSGVCFGVALQLSVDRNERVNQRISELEYRALFAGRVKPAPD